jgi:hypothetical protein
MVKGEDRDYILTRLDIKILKCLSDEKSKTKGEIWRFCDKDTTNINKISCHLDKLEKYELIKQEQLSDSRKSYSIRLVESKSKCRWIKSMTDCFYKKCFK